MGRPIGLLTDSQREFLRSGDPGKSDPSTIRRQIRGRVQTGLKDFALLFNEMDQRDIKQLGDTTVDRFNEGFEDTYLDAMGFLIRVAVTNSVQVSPLLWESIFSSYRKEKPNQIPIIDVHIGSKHAEDLHEQAVMKLKSGRPLSDEELRAVFENPLEIYQDFGSFFQQMVNPALLKDFVQSNLDLIDPQLSLAEENIMRPRDGPDIIARDDEDMIVLIEIKMSQSQPTSESDSIESAIQYLTEMVDEFGGKSRSRGILVTMDTSETIEKELDECDFIRHVSLLDIVFT